MGLTATMNRNLREERFPPTQVAAEPLFRPQHTHVASVHRLSAEGPGQMRLAIADSLIFSIISTGKGIVLE